MFSFIIEWKHAFWEYYIVMIIKIRQTNQPVPARFNKAFSTSFSMFQNKLSSRFKRWNHDVQKTCCFRNEVQHIKGKWKKYVNMEHSGKNINTNVYVNTYRNTEKCIVYLSDFNSENKYLQLSETSTLRFSRTYNVKITYLVISTV